LSPRSCVGRGFLRWCLVVFLSLLNQASKWVFGCVSSVWMFWPCFPFGTVFWLVISPFSTGPPSFILVVPFWFAGLRKPSIVFPFFFPWQLSSLLYRRFSAILVWCLSFFFSLCPNLFFLTILMFSFAPVTGKTFFRFVRLVPLTSPVLWVGRIALLVFFPSIFWVSKYVPKPC